MLANKQEKEELLKKEEEELEACNKKRKNKHR